MNINHFLNEATLLEGKKKNLTRADMGEAFKVFAHLIVKYTGIDLYKVLRKA